MITRVRVDRARVEAMIARAALSGAEQAARFMADEQRKTTRSRRLAEGVTHESGMDAQGFYARAGMKEGKRKPWFFWYFEEYRTGRGGGVPFIRPALWNNTRQVARMMLGRG